MSLYIFLIQRTGTTKSINCGLWLQCSEMGPSIVTNTPRWWGVQMVGETAPGWREGGCGHSAVPRQCFHEPKTVLKR